MKICLPILALFCFCLSTANSQETDSSYFAVMDNLVEVKNQMEDYSNDLSVAGKGIKFDELRAIHDIIAASNIGHMVSICMLATHNCAVIWSNTKEWSDTNTFNAPMICAGIDYNLTVINECSDGIQLWLSQTEVKLLIIEGHEFKKYLRDFVTKFKKLSADYKPYATACE